ncbi:acyclic terpene utilization AtuA family protein [Saccharopolyspora hattusasensis]|uniref:acyclic terpene utilization AtuA family protein n=1 Tax=Saccharopolyspora hattusasensis TaxID=1128679 RepID=UPI003D976A34
MDLAARAELDDLVLECLAERTIALGQQRKLRDSALGYDPRLRARFERLLPAAREHGVRILTNMGAANPLAAGMLTRDLLAELGLRGKIAVVTGDDVLDLLDPRSPALEDGIPLATTARSCRRTRTWAPRRCYRRWTPGRTSC